MTTFTTDSTQSDMPHRRLMTVEEFDNAWALGVYGPEERLELIEGEVIANVTPQESPHATGIRLADRALNRVFVDGYDVRTQLPLVLDLHNKPEPDVFVVVGSIRDYASAHPTTAVLVVEVSDSTLRYDRTTKAGLYARAGIMDYWILNIGDRVLEVHRQPALMSEMPLGHGYRSITRHTQTDIVFPLAAPHAALAVADLLP